MPEDPKYVNRLVNMIRRIVRSEFPKMTFLGSYEYSIQSVNVDLIDISPTDTTVGLPSLASVPMNPGLLGEVVTPTSGKSVVVIFLNGNPSRPVIIGIVGPNDKSSITVTGDFSIIPGGLLKVAGASDFVALGSPTNSNFSSLKTWADTHIHPTGVGPSGPPAAPSPTPSDVKSSKTKTD